MRIKSKVAEQFKRLSFENSPTPAGSDNYELIYEMQGALCEFVGHGCMWSRERGSSSSREGCREGGESAARILLVNQLTSSCPMFTSGS